MFVASPYAAVMMLLGVTTSTLAAVAMQLDAAAIDNGIYGYNGALCGIAAATFHPGSNEDWAASPKI